MSFGDGPVITSRSPQFNSTQKAEALRLGFLS